MKCPKCGFNSFEDSDVCKKCSHDLTAHKATYGLKPIVFPKEARIAMAESLAVEAPPAVAQQPAEQPADIFTFDLPDNVTTSPAKGEASGDVSFSFDEKPSASSPDILDAFSFGDVQPISAAKSPEDVFSDLLEPTMHKAAPKSAAPEPPLTGGAQADFSEGYDLSNFSWDDTPEISKNGVKKPVDDFDSLFGTGEESKKK